MKLLKIKRKIKTKNKNKNHYFNKEYAYKIFLGGISTAQISVTIWLEFHHKILEGISTAKITCDNTNKIIVSQDFGRNKYSKNIMIIYGLNDKFWWFWYQFDTNF